jgi:hypothetical protein
MENKINNEVKPKSVIIDGQLHKDFKRICKGKNLKIGAVIEDLIYLFLDNPKEVQSMIEKNKEAKNQ